MAVNNGHRSFVGRISELQEVTAALALDSVPRSVPTVVVVGPAGIGKTRLVEELGGRAAGMGADVHWARCWNGPGTPALWPWNQLLSQLALPPVDTGRGSDRFAAYIASIDAARDAADGRAVVLVVDDVQWADAATLELLHLLARDASPGGLALVVTLREPEAIGAEATDRLVALEREATTVRLGGLPLDDVRRLAHELGALPDGMSVDELHRRTGGNPFFVGELVRSRRGDVHGALPPGIRAAVGHHLDLVAAPVRRLLGAAAVQGRVFEPAVLATAAGLDPLEVEAHLRTARDVGLAAPVDAATWEFHHALIGEYLVGELTPHDLAGHHLRTADAIADVHGHDTPWWAGAIATHLLAAGSLCASERLLEAARTAARSAARQLAWEDQSRYLAHAVEAARATSASPEVLVELLVERCEAEKQLRRLDVAHDLAAEAVTIARGLADPRPLARVALAFPPDVDAIEIDDISDPDQRPVRDEALAALGDADPKLRARLQAALALSLYWETPTGDRAESHRLSAARRDELTADALASARRLGDDRTLAIALNARIYANWGPAARADRPALAEELINVASRLGDADLALSGRVWRVVELLEQGRLHDADRYIGAFERDARQIRSRLHLWTVARWRANRAVMDGRLDAAEQLAETALTLGCEIMPAEVAFHFYATTTGPIHYLRATLGDVLGYLRDTAAESPNVPAWQVGVAVAAANVGDLDLARRHIEPVVAGDFAALPRDLNFVPTMRLVANVAYLLDDATLGAAAYAELVPYSGRLAIHGTGYASYGAIDLALGEAAAAMGDTARARAHFEAARDQLRPTGSPYVHIAELFLGRLLAMSDPDAGRRYLVMARDGFAGAGLPSRVGEAAAALDELDARRRVDLVATGGHWQLRRHGAPAVELPPLKGFRALAELVIRPGEAVPALDLAAVLEGRAPGPRAVPASEPLLDGRAIREFQRRATELRVQLDRADAAGDPERSARLADELAAVAAALDEGRGFGGRRATMRSDADRARVNVTKHIRRTIARLAEHDAALADHLAEAVTTGAECSYSPGRSRYIWKVRRI